MSPTAAIAGALLLPTLAAALIAGLRERPAPRETVTGVATLATFGCVLRLLPEVVSGARPALRLWEMLPGVSRQPSLDRLRR